MPVEVAVTNNLHTDHLRQTPTDLRHIARRLQAPADLRHIARRLQAQEPPRHTNRQHLISMANRQEESVLHQRSARHRQAANRQLHQ